MKVLKFAWARIRRANATGHGFWEHVLQRKWLFSTGILMAVTWPIPYLPLVRSAAQGAHDGLIRDKAQSRNVIKVSLNEEGHWMAPFFGRTPVYAPALVHVLSIIASGSPSVIGVDFSTEHPDFEDFPFCAGWPPIVWARTADFEGTTLVRVRPFLAAGKPGPNRLSGIAGAWQDEDRIIRRFQRTYSTPSGPIQSFSTALVNQFCKADKESAPGCSKSADLNGDFETPALLISRYEIEAANLQDFLPVEMHQMTELELFGRRAKSKARPPAQGELCKPKDPNMEALFRNKIVIAGGKYEASADLHDTPQGPSYGLDIIAQMVQMELDGQFARELGVVSKIAIKLILALAMTWVYMRLRPLASAFVAFIVIPALLYFGGYLVLTLWLVLFDSIGFIFIVWAKQAYHDAHELDLQHALNETPADRATH
jgi:CHASE2 domain-containing sensor protein